MVRCVTDSLDLLQAYALFPQSFKDIIELLLPELRQRGLFWDDYEVPGGTYRENFYRKPGLKKSPSSHVSAKFRWHAGVPVEQHPMPEYVFSAQPIRVCDFV